MFRFKGGKIHQNEQKTDILVIGKDCIGEKLQL